MELFGNEHEGEIRLLIAGLISKVKSEENGASDVMIRQAVVGIVDLAKKCDVVFWF
jgi:hypothetical protein